MMHTAKSYASEWSTLTGRSESEVYVPVALRKPKPKCRCEGCIPSHGVHCGCKRCVNP